jgi:hypothetical protein
MPPFDGVSSNVWLHASVGELAPVDSTVGMTATSCANAYFTLTPQSQHRVTWIAPSEASDSGVTFSAAHASDSTSPYYINSVRSASS